jgi:hypothetical protein
MSDQQRQPTEEELRAYAQQLEEQMRQLRVEDVIVQTIVTLVNLGGRRAGLAQGTEGERDPEQLRLAIEGARALLPLIEDQLGPDGKAIRDALSQLQMAYVQISESEAGSGGGEQGGEPGAQGEQPKGPGPAQSSGRLWVPGQ